MQLVSRVSVAVGSSKETSAAISSVASGVCGSARTGGGVSEASAPPHPAMAQMISPSRGRIQRHAGSVELDRLIEKYPFVLVGWNRRTLCSFSQILAPIAYVTQAIEFE